MATYPYPSIVNRDRSHLSTHEPSSIKLFSRPSSPETTATIVFGLCALAIGAVTIWQNHKAWKIWHPPYGRGSSDQDNPVDHDPDLELGITTPAPPADLEWDQPSSGSTPGASPPPQITETSSDRDDTHPSALQSQEACHIGPAHTSQHSLTPSTPLSPPGERTVTEEPEASDLSQIPQG